MPRKNDRRMAATRSGARTRPVDMVAPEREKPGKSSAAEQRVRAYRKEKASTARAEAFPETPAPALGPGKWGVSDQRRTACPSKVAAGVASHPTSGLVCPGRVSSML
jgi:hypothetical protein